jgi:ABC-type uncharacterized transport system ATPase subunit
VKFKDLNELADIVVSIDEGKNISDGNVFSITDRGIRLVAHMKQLGMNVGTLQEIFIGMQLMTGNRVYVC